MNGHLDSRNARTTEPDEPGSAPRSKSRRAVLALAAGISAVVAQEAMGAMVAPREPRRIDMMNAADAQSVRLESTLTLSAQRLHVAYRIANLSAQEIFVLDAMFRPQGRQVLDNSLAYTLFDDDRLVLMRGTVRIPFGMQVEMPDMPLARRLPAGGVLEGVIDAALPLRDQHPYLPSPPLGDGPKQQTRQTQRLGLRIGWVRAADVTLPSAPSPVAGAELFRLAYRQVIEAQHLAESADQAAQISVLVTL